VVAVVVRCDLIIRGPDVAPMRPQRSRAWKAVSGRGSIPVPAPNDQLRADLAQTVVDPWWPLATVG
jgi:hypothetical protein